jgi:zinc/manganese transport system substrate-binding protein
VDRSGGDIHPLGNPHYHLDPRNGAAVAGLMADRMAELDPEAGPRYRARAASLQAEILERIAGWEAMIAGMGPRNIVVHHKLWEYLLDWLDLPIVGAVEHRPGIAPSPKHVEHLIKRGRALGDVILITATWDHVDAARHAADRMGAPLVVLPAAIGAVEGVDDYLGLFDTICARLRDASGP